MSEGGLPLANPVRPIKKSNGRVADIRKQSRDPLLRHCVTGPSDLIRTFRAEGRRRIDRPGGFLPYFFNPAVQLSTTVIGVGAGSLVWVLTRKRWPSRLGT